jgi:enoyl-CoA hydratase/carnithine racemase
VLDDPSWTGGSPLDASGRPTQALVTVDLDREFRPAELARASRAAREDDRLLLGVTTRPLRAELAELVDALDLTLGPSAEPARKTEPAPKTEPAAPRRGAARSVVEVADPMGEALALRAAAEQHPQASVVLAGLLRATEHSPVRAALDAESLAYSTLLGGAEFQCWLATRKPRDVPTPAGDPVLVRRVDDRLLLRLNRPERRNAYGREMRDALVEALRIAVYDDSVARVLIDGAGPMFCAGGDLDEFGTTPDPVTAHLVRTRAGAARLLDRLADRVQVRVHGWCVGAGIELPAFAGLLVAAPSTRFRLPELAMGLIPGAGGTVSLPRRIGRWRTLYLALTGRELDVGTALDWGLVDRVEPRPVSRSSD